MLGKATIHSFINDNPVAYHHSNDVALHMWGKSNNKHFLNFPLPELAYNFVIRQHKLIKYDSIDSVIFEEYNDKRIFIETLVLMIYKCN